jgi:phage gpG-like protein
MPPRVQVELVGSWRQAAKLLAAGSRIEQFFGPALEQEAQLLRGKIVQGIGKNVQDLSASTRARRRGTRPLVDTGDLRNSIAVVGGDDEKFIGVPRGAGRYRIGDVHESGRTIVMQMTDKQRKWLHANLPGTRSRGTGAGGPRILIVHIPARPFIKPVWDAEQGKIPQRFIQRILAMLQAAAGAGGGTGV